MLGGAEGQAKVKEMLVPFVVGCIVVFGGFGLWKIAITLGNQLESVTTPKQDAVDGVGGGIQGGMDAVEDALEEGKKGQATGGVTNGGSTAGEIGKDALDKAKTK